MNNFNKTLSVLLMLASSLFSVAQEAQTSEKEIINSYVNNMVKVKGGTFMMGATDGFGYESERPVHSVSLSSFMISKYEVTQQLWQVVMGDNPSTVKGDNLPVNNISWDDCQTFIAKLNEMSGRTYRLATEAEWEFAARGGTAGKDLGENNGYQYAGGYQNITSMDSYVWNSDNSDNTIHPVGTKKPNELGLYDMSGNVCEYVQDYYTWSYSSEAQQDPTGADSGENRVFRGGSYERPTWQCRLASRFGTRPNVKTVECGLRLAMDVVTGNAKVMVVTTMDGKRTKLGLKNEANITIEEPYLVYKSNVAEARFELNRLRDITYVDVKPLLGDASGDGVVNRADVDETVLYTLGNASGDFVFNNADVNNDKIVNVTDIVRILNLIKNPDINEVLQSRSATNSDNQTANSQQNQYAIYNYRNDNDFNAWLNVDIDSITYSCIDTLGVEHDVNVVQEVWTPYQVYRIPIEAIDSIGFRAPETKYNEKVFFITDNYIPYIINVDDLNITFDKSIPNDLLPTLGQILVADTSEDPLEDGFAGRIIDILNTDDGKIFICEEVALSDIFDRLLFISKCATDGELEEESFQNVRKSKTRSWIDIDKVIHIDLDPVEIKPDDEDDNKEKFPITINYKPDLDIVCFVNVIKNHPAIAKITFKQTHSLYFQAKYEIDKPFTKEWWLGKKDIRIHIPNKAVDAVIKPYIRFGAFVDASAKVKFEYTVPFFNFEHTFGLDYNEARDEENRVQLINEANLTYEKPTMKLSVDGSLAFGLAVKLGANLIHKKLLNFESTFHIGPKLIGHFDLYSERLAEDANIYRQLKTTTLQLNGYVAMPKATYQFFGSGPKLAKRNTWKGATWSNKVVKEKSFIPNDLFPDGIEFTWYINKWNLLPHFDEPTVKEVTANSAYAYLHPYQNLIFPVDLGVAFKKYSTGDVIEYDYGSYWGEEHNKETKYEHIFEDLEASTTYKVYPTVSLFGLKMDAEPSVDYTVSDRLLVNPNIVTIKKGETAEVTVSGGSGKYSTIDDNPEVAKALLFNYNLGTGERKAILTISGVDIGETYLTILDTNNASNCILKVKVIDSDVPSLTLSSTSLDLSVGKNGSAKIISGSGKYTIKSSDPDVATAEISNNIILVTAHKAGPATITVTDTETSLTACIDVTVSEEEPPYTPVKTETFTVNGVSFNMVKVEGGTFMMGSEKEANEKPIHEVKLNSFAIGQTELTQELWEAVMGSLPPNISASNDNIAGLHRPVVYVSWYDCQEFITKLNTLTGRSFRLPTEAEWEFAARGGNLSQGYAYSGSNTFSEVGWFISSAKRNTYDVATKKPNELGIYDMSGNVWEWCQDWYGSDYYNYSPIENPMGPTNGAERIKRGGTWMISTSTYRVAFRDHNTPETKAEYTGLRLALSEDSSPIAYLSCPDDHHPHMIDLGLPSGTKWACCNLGASKPEEFGGYYAWGETEEKDNYFWDNYMCEDAECGTTKDPIYTWNGNKLYADIAGSKFDVATSKWGPSWHMPSSTQMDELLDECIWTWCDGDKTKYNGTSVKGYIISSKVNNNKLFLPAAGNYFKDRLLYKNESCLYWSSSQFDGSAFEGENYYTNSNSAIGMDYKNKTTYVDLRYYGQTIRPVTSVSTAGSGSTTDSGAGEI